MVNKTSIVRNKKSLLGTKRRITPNISARIAQNSANYDMRIHVFPIAGKWTVTIEGKDKALGTFLSQANAIDYAENRIVSAHKAFIAVHTNEGAISKIISK